MCGIVGYVGKNKNTIEFLINGLKSLEYRGYDSAGIAYMTDKINIVKKEGKLENLEKIVNYENSNLGIGHTRWATHGVPSLNNAHPHHHGKITLVHNGIIENYESIKKDLSSKGYKFYSETDTEVACALIDYLYSTDKDMIKVLNKCQSILEGAYAFGIINDDDKNNLYIMKKDSPLIVAKSSDGFFIASDVPAILKYTNKYYLIENDEIGKIGEQLTIYDKNLNEVKKELQTFDLNLENAMKNGYDHFMLKEINEQPIVIEETINSCLKDGKQSLRQEIPDLSNYEQIHIVACGSAYHTGLVGKYLIEQFGEIPVSVCIASEYRYKKVFYNCKTLVIFISQSGETADTLACLRKVKEKGIDTLAIINVVGSSIAREADKTLYIKAGCEIAVATTKAYLAQVNLLSLIALNIAINKKKLDNVAISEIFEQMKALPNLIKDLINRDYKNIAKEIYKNENIFFIGRSVDEAIAKEGALKLKEISYIHCEAYAAGELKHGSISLIDKDTPVVAIVTDKNIASKTISNIKEVKARGAKVILIITEELDNSSDYYDFKIVIPSVSPFIEPMISIIPLQLIAYEVALLRGCDIDKPKNLAKSVTVE